MDVFCSTSTDRSRKSSSLLLTFNTRTDTRLPLSLFVTEYLQKVMSLLCDAQTTAAAEARAGNKRSHSSVTCLLSELYHVSGHKLHLIIHGTYTKWLTPVKLL